MNAMTAMKLAPMNTPSSSPSKQLYETPMKPKHLPSLSFFNDLSYFRHWSEVEPILANALARIDTGNDTEIGWIEGRVHETRSTQKEVEILLVHPPRSKEAPEARRDAHEALRVFVTCPELARFVFAINQDIKISLKGARVIHELVPQGSSTLPFSLVFSSSLAILSVHGGVCMPDGVVVDTRQGRDDFGCICLESAASRLSLQDGTPSPYKSSPKFTQSTLYEEGLASTATLAPADCSITGVFDDYASYPALSNLIEGMMTPLLGIIESVKSVSTTANGELCVGLTLADASSYSSKRGFRLTCFTSRSRLARDLPTPAEGDAILLKAVKINKWLGGIIGTVYPNKLDWITYNPKTDAIGVPRHAKSEPVDPFYEDLEKRKEMFRQFVGAMESGPWRDNGTNDREA